jgi:hypothetical protein
MAFQSVDEFKIDITENRFFFITVVLKQRLIAKQGRDN